MKKLFLISLSILCLGFVNHSLAQSKTTSTQDLKQPKLVIGVVIDQMRHDYIYRYWNKYGNGGFKKLVSEGYFFRNAHYNYMPTYTGPGHASIYSGTTPATHGIISNDWFVKETGKMTYCTDDETVKTVGSESKAGLMSPKNLLVTTIGDELKLATNQQAKVFAVSLKDRSSILPAGHSANGAFWFDGSVGKFITSTHYISQLPAWLNEFNDKQLAKSYLQNGWNTLYPIETYTESIVDDNKYERAPNKKSTPTFPYDYKQQLEKNNYDIIKSTPAGNTLTKDAAIACIKAEQLGKGKQTDMLCISFSATDYVGHYYAPRSIEVEDTYLRLDKDLEELLNYLNSYIGKENYVLFLTADHGGADNPIYSKDLKIPAGYISDDDISLKIKSFCYTQFKDSLVLMTTNQQLFLNEAKIKSLGLNKNQVEESIADYLITIDGIAEAYPSQLLRNSNFTDISTKYLIQKGFNHKRSGNVAYNYNPAWIDYYSSPTGTTHGSPYPYDTHVPILFYGAGISKGFSVRKIHTVDIAPTLSMMLHISFPNGTTGEPLPEVLK